MMRRQKGLLWLLWLAVWLLPKLPLRAADWGEASMVNLTLTGGLAGETVHAVMTDHGGTVWIATNSGISAYNGRQVHSIRISNTGGRTLTVNDLCETASKHIYAATEDGLYCLRYGNTRFERVLAGEVGAVVSVLAVGDTVYIGSEQGVQYYDGRQLRRIDLSPSHQGLDNIVRQYAVADDGRLWFLSRHDLNSLDPRSGHIERYALGRRLILARFAPAGNGRFVIGTRGSGLFTYDVCTRQLQQVDGVGNLVTSVQQAADGSICVATDGAGAYRLTVEDGKLKMVERFSTEGDDQHRLPSNGTYCYYRDASGVNWFGFVRHGVAYGYHNSGLFKTASIGDFTTEGMNVRTYCRHGHDGIIGTQDGFYYVNDQTNVSRYYSSQELGGGHIVNTIVWYDGCFYIGTYDGGLRQFDPQTQQLLRQPFLPELDACSIGDLKVGPDGRLWIGCGLGLVIVGEGRVQQHFTEQNSHIVGGLILSITFDRSGNAWLTGGRGCALYSVRSQQIVEPRYPQGFFDRQPWMRGAQGHDGLVFMRTGPQTFYTNEQMTDFGELALPVSFYDKWCRNLVDDMRGHYWLTSERGVFRFDYALQEMQQFGYGEGLRGSQINDMSLSEDHRLWVATSGGLFYTDSTSLAAWQQDDHYRVLLFNIRRSSDMVTNMEGYDANERHHIRIGWNLTSEVLQAEPMLLDYANPTGRLYEYRVDGDVWQLVDDGRPIDIRHLLLGTHRLEVRRAGAPGTTSVYRLTVVPSTGAIVELVLLVVALVLLWLGWRFRKTTKVLLNERDEIEDALVESEELRVKSELKYERVKVNEDECREIVDRMKEYLERERVYTDQDLKMKDLADVLHLSAPKLSQVFNLYLKENYYEFINRYRLEEFKRLIAEGEYKRYTITALSEQCGFKKSNFFTTFRKVEGVTPMEYLKKQGIKV